MMFQRLFALVRTSLRGLLYLALATSLAAPWLLAFETTGHTRWQPQDVKPTLRRWWRPGRPIPASELPSLGKGQQAVQLAGALPPAATHRVATTEALVQALTHLTAGAVLEIGPGRYTLERPLASRHAGSADRPITVRAAQPGTVMIEVRGESGFAIVHPHWVFENFSMRGTCVLQSSCEHAFHVMGEAHHTVIRNVRLEDFNAHLKVNGLRSVWPDAGVLQHATLTNSQPRDTRNPVTPVDIVGASHWQVRDNLVTNFPRRRDDGPSYGIFVKGGGRDTVIEGNVVVCARSDLHQMGTRIGISVGGGRTGREYSRTPQADAFEHHHAQVRHNVVAHCNEAGLDSNHALGTEFTENTLINTHGVLLRGGSKAVLRDNLMDGKVNVEAGSEAEQINNRTGDLRSLLRDPDRLDLRPR